MLLQEFAKERGVSAGTVSKYIRRHQADFEGHLKEKGNQKELDEEAIQLLNSIYPLQIIEVKRDEETERLLKKATEHIIELQQRVNDMSAELMKNKEEMLEMKTAQLRIEVKAESLEEQNKEKDEIIAKLKNRNLIERIMNKD